MFTDDAARVPEPRRRHLLPLGLPGDPPGGRGEGQHHLQDPVQRRGRDDRRPAGRRHHHASRRSRARSRAEGAKRVVVVTDDIASTHGVRPPGRHASSITARDLDAVQRELREIAGVTVLIYEQTCAAEKRRRRKKGELVPIRRSACSSTRRSAKAAAIAACSATAVASRRSRRSSAASARSTSRAATRTTPAPKGFCPSFVGVLGGALRKKRRRLTPEPDCVRARLAALPLPACRSMDRPVRPAGHRRRRHRRRHRRRGDRDGRAPGRQAAPRARLHGLRAEGRLGAELRALAPQARAPEPGAHRHRSRPTRSWPATWWWAPRPEALQTVRHGGTRVLANTHVQTTGRSSRATRLRISAAIALLAEAAVRRRRADRWRPSTRRRWPRLSRRHDRRQHPALGFAWQRGAGAGRPRGADARAIELNGVAVETNKQAFALGRLAAHDPAWKARLSGREATVVQPVRPQDLEQVIETPRAFSSTPTRTLPYAKRYLDFVRRVEAAERAAAPEGRKPRLTDAVARNLLQAHGVQGRVRGGAPAHAPGVPRRAAAQFEGDFRLEFNLAPPLFAEARTRAAACASAPTGRGCCRRSRAGALPPAARHAFRPLRLHGGARQERHADRRVRELVERLLDGFAPPHRLAEAARIAGLAQKIRGYGHVKDESIRAYRDELAAALDGAPEGRAAPAFRIA